MAYPERSPLPDELGLLVGNDFHDRSGRRCVIFIPVYCLD